MLCSRPIATYIFPTVSNMPHVSLSSTLISSFFAPQSCHQPPFRFWDNLPTQKPHVLCIYALWLIPSLSSNNHHSFSHLFDIACITTLGQFNLMPMILVSMEEIWSRSLSWAQAHPHSCLLLTIPDQLLYTFSALLIGPLALWLGPTFLFPELPFSSMPHVLHLMVAMCFHPLNSFPAELFA